VVPACNDYLKKLYKEQRLGFHITSEKAVQSILENGLQTCYGGQSSSGVYARASAVAAKVAQQNHSQNKVFFTKDLDPLRWYYQDLYAKRNERYGIIAIRLTNVLSQYDPGMPGGFISKSNISRNNLVYLGNDIDTIRARFFPHASNPLDDLDSDSDDYDCSSSSTYLVEPEEKDSSALPGEGVFDIVPESELNKTLPQTQSLRGLQLVKTKCAGAKKATTRTVVASRTTSRTTKDAAPSRRSTISQAAKSSLGSFSAVGKAMSKTFGVIGASAGLVPDIVEAGLNKNATNTQRAAIATRSVPVVAGITAAVEAKEAGKSDAQAAAAFFLNVFGMDLSVLKVDPKACPTSPVFSARFGYTPPGC
jgi:hypothetical protein